MNSSTTTKKRPPFLVFLATTVLVFVLSLSAAESVGFVPCQIDDTCSQVSIADLPQLGVEGSAPTNAQRVTPVGIQIPSVGIDLPVQNPTTTDVDALDALLNKGPAHYAQSADLGVNGNVLIFAHSSHLPIVTNKMFQAFNQIPNVNPGASITIVGADGKNYLYSVDSVKKADTSDGTTINLDASQGKILTLVTCDTLTGTSARFILTAHFVGIE